jgi:hypothetical protein
MANVGHQESTSSLDGQYMLAIKTSSKTSPAGFWRYFDTSRIVLWRVSRGGQAGEGEQVATCLLRSLGKQVPTCLLVSLSTQVHPLADKSQQARPLGEQNSVRAGTYLRAESSRQAGSHVLAERSRQAGSHVLAERSRQAGPHVLAKRPPRAGGSCSLRSQYAGGYLPAKICREAAGAKNR